MRRTYHYDEVTKRMVEGPAPRKEHSGDGWRFSDRLYSANPFIGQRDGEVIDSRKKHREYMARHNLTTVDDYNTEWATASQRRERHYTDGGDHKARREAVERSILKLEK